MTNRTEDIEYQRQGVAACHAATVWIGSDLTSFQAYVAYTYMLMFAAFCCCCCFSGRGKGNSLSRVDRLNQLIADEESDAKLAQEKRAEARESPQRPLLDGHFNELPYDVEVAQSATKSAREPMGATSSPRLHLRDVLEPRSLSPGVRTPMRSSTGSGRNTAPLSTMPIDVCGTLADVFEAGRGSAAMGTSASTDLTNAERFALKRAAAAGGSNTIGASSPTVSERQSLTNAEIFALKRAAAAAKREANREPRGETEAAGTSGRMGFCSVAASETTNAKKKLQIPPPPRIDGMKLQYGSPRAQDAPNASSRKSRPARSNSRASSAEISA